MSPSAHRLGSLGRGASFALIGLVYLTAGVAGLAATGRVEGPYLGLVAAFVASTLAVYVWSFATGNSSCFDAWWSLAPGAAVWALPCEGGPRAWLVRALVTAWALRLTWNWARGWTGFGHEDWRYVDMRARTGALWWPVSFLAIHLFPAALVTLGSLPLVPALESAGPLGALDLLAASLGAAALALETLADEQLRAFTLSKPPRDAVLQSGLWAYSRHPNYLGEIGFWWSLALFATAAGAAGWHLVGAAAITLLFYGASIPMIEKRHAAKRPAYADYQRRVPMLVPWRAPRR